VSAIVFEGLGAVSGLGTEWWRWLSTTLALLMAMSTVLMGAVLALSAVIQLVLVVTVDWCGSRRRLLFG
jgi:hypothetical protein